MLRTNTNLCVKFQYVNFSRIAQQAEKCISFKNTSFLNRPSTRYTEAQKNMSENDFSLRLKYE